MLDDFDASHDRLRLAVAQALRSYGGEELFDCLSDPNPIVRTAAARRLHIRGTRSAFQYAIGLIDRPRFELREIGAFVLGQLGTPACPFADETYERLSNLLEDDYGEVRAAAVGALGSLATLGHFPPGRSVVTIQDMLSRELAMHELGLSDPASSKVRASIAFARGAIKDDRSREALMTLLDDPDPDVRETAELGLQMYEGEREPFGQRRESSVSAAGAG